jgi:hypothetical protein
MQQVFFKMKIAELNVKWKWQKLHAVKWPSGGLGNEVKTVNFVNDGISYCSKYYLFYAFFSL